ncbi:MAG: redoxin domain-containing protein, partial [Betaproteobacteria bacterium]|nr:redoxin domain-containing protein [Betaproteobacteria bacterium]
MDQPAPDVELPATSGRSIRLSSLLGKTLVLYFYP